MDEVIERFAESGYSRLPVYHDTIDNIIGVVHEKDCFAACRSTTKMSSWRTFCRPDAVHDQRDPDLRAAAYPA